MRKQRCAALMAAALTAGVGLTACEPRWNGCGFAADQASVQLVDAGLDGPTAIGVVAGAQAWNGRTDAPEFTLAPASARIRIRKMDLPGIEGQTHFGCPQGSKAAQTTTTIDIDDSPFADLGHLQSLVAHELGHALGLWEDEFRAGQALPAQECPFASLMHWDSQSYFQCGIVGPTAFDVTAINKIYL